MRIRFYSYKDYFDPPLTSELCVVQIKKILTNNSRVHWLGFLTELSKKLSFWTSLDDLIKFQKDNFGETFPEDVVINRRAVLVLTQFLFSIKEPEFSVTDKYFNTKDLGFVFLITNEFIDLNETIPIKKVLRKKIFFTSFKIIHTAFSLSDIKIMYRLFEKFYASIIGSKNIDAYNNLISKELGYDLQTYKDHLKSFMGLGNSGTKFKNLTQMQSVKYDNIDYKWENRENALPIPFEYRFLEDNPLVERNGNHYLYDYTNLFLSTIRKVFTILADEESNDFRHEFGKEIVEPILNKELQSIFSDKDIKILKVATKKYEYGDFGISYGENIFLFEIKSAYFKPRIRFSKDYAYFISAFDGKFIKGSGVEQQVKRIKDIDSNYAHFKQIANLAKKKYTVIPIILSFDDSIQALGCNWYVNNRFSIYKRLLIKKLYNINISENMCIMSFTELIILKEKYSIPQIRIDILLEYINRRPDINSFRDYMETKPSV